MGGLRQPVPVPSPYAYQKASWLVPALRAALALLNDPEISVRNAAKRLGLSVSTLYRHAPGLRSRVGEKA